MLDEEIKQANAIIDKELLQLTNLADTIFDHPEIGRQEVFASKELEDYLEQNGFQVQRGIGSLPTAFKAVWKAGEGGPVIGLLCEYDALQGMGHGCGHHMQGPAIVGAAKAIKEASGGKPYTLIVYGTPGEENISGKCIMIKDGVKFEDLDVALMMHGGPATQTDIKCLACTKYEIIYHGKAAHAALKPEAGRSSLDAMMLGFHGVECLREHVPTDVRLHYNIMDAGGTAANVVPAYTRAELYVRADTVGTLDATMKRLEAIFEGAALMTDTKAEYRVMKRTENKIPNFLLNDVIMKHARALGAPNCQPPRARTGSTDFGDVLHRTVGSCIRVAFVPEGTPSHSQTFIDAGKTQAAHYAVMYGAKILADTVLEILAKPELLQDMKKEFKERLAAEVK